MHDLTHARYDHGLAEFPAFRFGKRRCQSDELMAVEAASRIRSSVYSLGLWL